jgi:VWFA-related protein
MMRTARLVFGGVVAFALLGPARALPLHGQNPSAGTPQTTFRATTSLVEVDAVILDKSGNFVPGLTAEDLSILEDNKPQAIQQFYMVTHDGSAIAPNANLSFNGSQAPEEHAHRVFVLMFDEGSLATESLMRVKRGAELFIQNQLGPGDVGGVFVNGGMYRGRLTTDKNELLLGVKSVKPAFDTRQSLLASLREFPKIPSEVEALQIEQGAIEITQRLGDAACQDDPAACQEAGSLQGVENLLQQKARLYVRQSRTLAGQTVQNLQYVATGLSHIPGRKTVMFLSEGFFVEESRSILQTVAAQAARGGTTIYSIDGRGNVNGLSSNPDVVRASVARSGAFDTGDDGPMILTSSTGGFMVHGMDDFSRAFGLVVRDTSTYYVIGYRPDNSTMDGKFRKIELKANVPGLSIRARKGYLAVTLPPLEQLRTSGKD